MGEAPKMMGEVEVEDVIEKKRGEYE